MGWKSLIDPENESDSATVLSPNADEKKVAILRKVLNVMCIHVKIEGYNIAVPVVNQLQSLAHLARVSTWHYF